MSQITIPEKFYAAVEAEAQKNECSVDEQAEFWLTIGKLAEENPDATYNMIMEALGDVNEDDEDDNDE